ncbi:MAG: diguanylate cyclase domain-containing protein [Syntrophaceae bacterium]
MDLKNIPKCTIDYPLEITSAEITDLTRQINTLLKSTYLLGISRDVEGTFQSLFDIAEEVAGVDCCGYVSEAPDSRENEFVAMRHVNLPGDKPGELISAPAVIAKIFGKAVFLDSGKADAFLPVCEAWGAASLVAFPLQRDREIMGALVFGKRASNPFTVVQIKLLWVLAMQAENHLHQSEAVRALSFYSFLDPLTHLYNRRFFDDQLEKEILRSRRNGKPFSLLMLDLDGFKAYNDRFLHSSGDIALQEFASILRDSVREVDTVARLGGDEFAIILVESGADGARDLARRIIDRLGRHLLPGLERGRTERLSVSVGLAAFPSDSFDKDDLFRKADRALYIAKSQGGGKYSVFHEIAELLAIKPAATDIPIQKIYDAARSVVDMDKFLEILLFTAMQGLSAGRGSIVVADPRGGVTLRAVIGFPNGEENLAPGTTMPSGPITSWVVENGQPLVVSGQEELPVPKPMKKNGYRTTSFLAIPLVHEGQPLGALHLTNKRDKSPFTQDDLSAFRPVALEIASILHQGIAFRENVKSFSTSILQSLSSALELRFPFLSGHSTRVREMATRIGVKLGLGEEDLTSLATAAALHDIGIVGIPGTILFKKRKLTEQELEIARKHPLLGSKLLEGVPGMDETRRIILEHQEFFDGSGYPYGLRGEQISLGARILSVAEFYDSITSERPHRGRLLAQEALQLIRNGSNTIFDPDVARAFVEDPPFSGDTRH